MKKNVLMLIFVVLISGCRDEGNVVDLQNPEQLKKLRMIESGVSEDELTSIRGKMSIKEFLVQLHLIEVEDEWADMSGLIDFHGTESSVNFYSVLGGGVSFMTRYSRSENRDGLGVFSSKILEHSVTGFSYSIDGEQFRYILDGEEYVKRR